MAFLACCSEQYQHSGRPVFWTQPQGFTYMQKREDRMIAGKQAHPSRKFSRLRTSLGDGVKERFLLVIRLRGLRGLVQFGKSACLRGSCYCLKRAGKVVLEFASFKAQALARTFL